MYCRPSPVLVVDDDDMVVAVSENVVPVVVEVVFGFSCVVTGDEVGRRGGGGRTRQARLR